MQNFHVGLLEFSNGSSSEEEEAAAAEAARDRLREFQVKMYALEDLLQDQDQTEFCVVTVPTELAVAESERLVAALGTEGIAVRNVVVNQVLRGGGGGGGGSGADAGADAGDVESGGGGGGGGEEDGGAGGAALALNRFIILIIESFEFRQRNQE